MILVGYHKTGAYRLLNPITGKIVVSRDIVVDENSPWNWEFNDIINKPIMSNNLYEEGNEQGQALVEEPQLNKTPFV